ncbi:MAG: archaeosortase/exosortase family protein [Bacteroidales bacterium]
MVSGTTVNRHWSAARKFIRKHNLDALTDVTLFILITLFIHYLYRYWAIQLQFAPVRELMISMHEGMAHMVYDQSLWIVKNVLGIDFTAVDQTRIFYFSNSGYIAINKSCSGLKQILQFALLMAVYPGLWKRKLWFIPAGIVIVHLTNLFRIAGLSVVIVTEPEHWDLSHDYFFRPFFYVVIFSLWVLWVEKFGRPKKSTKKAGTEAPA